MDNSNLDPVILAIFGPPPEGIDLTENEAPKNDGAVIAMLALASIALILRFMARVVQRSGLHPDDWMTIVALLFVAGTVGISIGGGALCAGKHIWVVKLTELVQIFKLMYSYVYIYSLACATTKLSILMFYQRIFLTTDTLYRISLYTGYFLTLIYPIIVAITMGNACKPLSFFWTQFTGATGTCIDTKKFFLIFGIVNMINDVIIVAIPIPQIFKLQMSLKKKVAVTGIMLLGSFVCVASILRIYYLNIFTNANDVTWVMGPVFIWSAIEPSLGIVSACLPHLGPLRHMVRDKLSTAMNSSGMKGSPEGSAAPWRSGKGGQSTTKSKTDNIFTYGGSRFSVRGDKNMMKLVDADDEIGLTNRVMAGSVLGKAHSTGSGSDENVNQIVIQSSFVQTSSAKDHS